MPKNAIERISKSPASESIRAACIREWLVKFGAVHNREITPLLIASWEEALVSVRDIEVLRGAFLRAQQTSRFFPTPADVLGQIGKAEVVAVDVTAEQKWQGVLRYIQNWYAPDFGISPRAPAVSAAVEHAVNAAGGWRWIESCPDSDLPWAKTRFIEAWKQFSSAAELQALPTSAEARAVLAEAARRMEHDAQRKALPKKPAVAAQQPTENVIELAAPSH